MIRFILKLHIKSNISMCVTVFYSYFCCSCCVLHISGSESVMWLAILTLTAMLNLCSVQFCSCGCWLVACQYMTFHWLLVCFQLPELSLYDEGGSKHAMVSECLKANVQPCLYDRQSAWLEALSVASVRYQHKGNAPGETEQW